MDQGRVCQNGMVGRQSKATALALVLVVGFAVAPGFALAASADAGNATAPVSAALAQDDGANTTLENLTVEELTLENVTVEGALVDQATAAGENATNLTADRVTVENATLTNVTFQNLTLNDRELVSAVVGGARATPGQNNSLESLEITDRTIDGLVIEEASVEDASGFQPDAVEVEADGQADPTADDAAVAIGNVTVESVAQDATDAGAENGTEAEGDSDDAETETAGDE